jgi:WD40 repeat protein
MNPEVEEKEGGKAPDAAVDFEKAVLLLSLPWDASWISAVSFVGPKHLAAGNNLGEILLWELPDKPEPAPEPPAEKAKPSGGGEKGEKPLCEAVPPARQLMGHTNVINRLICAENRWLISASNDHTVRYWDLQAAPGAPAKIVLNIRAIEDATRRKSSGRKPPPPMEVEVRAQEAAKTIEGGEWIVGLGMSQDQSTLITGDDAGQVVIFSRAAGTEKKRWQVKGWAYAVALSPDLKQAVVSERYPLVFDSGRHTAVKLWDAETGAVQHDLSKEFKDMQIAAAAYSPDGKVLAIGRGGEADGMNGKVFLLDPATGAKQRELTPGHQYGITDLCFHPDGQHLASCGRDTVARIWNIADGKLVKELGKPRGGQFKDWIHAISFSPDGTRLAAADMAGLVHVWQFGG